MSAWEEDIEEEIAKLKISFKKLLNLELEALLPKTNTSEPYTKERFKKSLEEILEDLE